MLFSARACASIMFGFIFSGAAFADTLHDADLLRCSFKPDVGVLKSMQATCSAYPEQTFSTRYDQHDATEHCKTTPLRESSAIRDFRVNISGKYVTWKFDFVADPEEKAQLIQRAIRDDKITEDEAKAQIEENLTTDKIAKLASVQKIFDKLIIDPSTDQLLDEPILQPALLLLFTDRDENNFSVYISATKDAILSEYVRFEDQSWLRMSFGRCDY
jgi:hypothetical protein